MRCLSNVLTAVLMLSAVSASAQMTGEITPFIGVQGGGSVEIAGRNTDVDATPVFGAFLSFDRGRGRVLDIVLAHQQTRAERQDPFEPVVSSDVTVDYAQIGGRVLLKPGERVDPYIGMTAGVTRFEVDNGSAFRFGFAFDGGADFKLSGRTALRLDARYTQTFTGGSANISCRNEGECTGFGSGSSFTQLTGLMGVVIRF